MKKNIVTLMAAAVVGMTANGVGAEVIQNGSFELNYDGWTVVDNYKLLQDGKLDPSLASKYRIDSGTPAVINSGDQVVSGTTLFDYASAWENAQFSFALPATIYGTDQNKVAIAVNKYPETVRVYQDVAMPEGAYALSWDMQYKNVSPWGFTNEQYIAVNIRDLNDNPLTPEPLFITDSTYALDNGGMQTYTVDISQFAGQTVRVDVEMVMENYYMVVGLDNFRVDVNEVETLPPTKLPAGWLLREKKGWQGEKPPGLEKNGKMPPGLLKQQQEKTKKNK